VACDEMQYNHKMLEDSSKDGHDDKTVRNVS
jgi:hypothetical protein